MFAKGFDRRSRLGLDNKDAMLQAFEAAKAANNTVAAGHIARALADPAAPWNSRQQGNQGAFSYGVDKAQDLVGAGFEGVGKITGLESLEEWGKDYQLKQQEDIRQGNYQPKYRKSLRETYNEDGFFASLGWLGEKSAENAASGGAALVGGAAAGAAAFVSTPAALAISGVTLAGSFLMGTGESVKEQKMASGTDEYNAAIANGTGAIIMVLDKFGAGKFFTKSELGSMTMKQVTNRLLKEGKKDAAEGVMKEFVEASTKQVIKSRNPLKFAKDAAKRGIVRGTREGITETLQEGAVVAGTSLNEGEMYLTPDQMVDRFIESYAIGKTLGASTSAVVDSAIASGKMSKATYDLFTPKKGETRPEEAAAAMRFQKIADSGFVGKGENKADPKDVDTTSDNGAVQIMSSAHADIAEEIKAEVSVLKDTVKSKEQELAFNVANGVAENHEDISKYHSGLRLAKNKAKAGVTNAQLDAIRRMTDADNNVNGERLVNLIKEAEVISSVHNKGLRGGLTRWTDYASPFSNPSGYSTSSQLNKSLQMLATGAVAYTNPGLLPVQGAIWAGGKLVDKVTGNRSRLQKFIEANIDGEGFPEPTGVDLRFQQALEKQKKDQENNRKRLNEASTALEKARAAATVRENNKSQFDAGLPPFFGDPNANISGAPASLPWFRLGLAEFDNNGRINLPLGKNPEGVKNAITTIDTAIDSVLAKYPNRYDKIAAEYKKKRREGGQIGIDDEYSVFLNVLGSEIDEYGSPETQNAQKIPVQPIEDRLSTRQQLGKQENQQFLSDLKTQVQTLPQTQIDVVEKAKLLGAMDQLGQNLGRGDRVKTALNIAAEAENKGVRSDLIEQYMMPYVQRVEQQQNASLEQEAIEDDLDISMKYDPSPQFIAVNNPMRISPSRTSGANSVMDSLNEDRQIGFEVIKQDPKLLSSMATKLRNTKNYPAIQSTKTDDVEFLEDFIEFGKNNLVALHNGTSPEFRARAKQWYVGANKVASAAQETYNIPLHAAAGVYAALSPQKDWYMNAELGNRVMDIHTNKQNTIFDAEMKAALLAIANDPKRKLTQKAKDVYLSVADQLEGQTLADLPPELKGYFVRMYDEVHNDEKGHRVLTPEGNYGDYVLTSKGNRAGTAWNGFRDINKAINILDNSSRENIHEQLGQRHKVRSFYNNILDPFSDRRDTTIDTHAVAAALLMPLGGSSIPVSHNFVGAGRNENIGVFGSYGIYHEMYSRAADEVGILPREMQSITWEAIRGLFEPSFKSQKKNVQNIENIWNRYRKGDILIDQARSEIYDTAGGIIPAEWEQQQLRSDDDFNQSIRPPTNAGALSSSGRPTATQGDGRGAVSGSPRVLPRPPEKIAPELPLAPIDVKPFVPDAVNRMEIGKKGGRYENGMTLSDARSLMKALNISYIAATKLGEMKYVLRKIDAPKEMYTPITNLPSGFNVTKAGGTKTFIVNMQKGSKRSDGKIVTPIDELSTAMHEVAHTLEGADLAGANQLLQVVNPLNDKMAKVRRGSFREYLYNYILDNGTDSKVVKEIINLQENAKIYVENNPSETVSVRGITDMYEAEMRMFKAANPDVEVNPEIRDLIHEGTSEFVMSYMRDLAEFAVDPTWTYMMNPRFAKEAMPETTRVIRRFFNNKDGSPVTFFGHPLATLVAIALAMMAAAARERDEEEQAQIPQGALNPQMGLLSA